MSGRFSEAKSGTTPNVLKSTARQTCSGVSRRELTYSRKKASPATIKSPIAAYIAKLMGILGEFGDVGRSADWVICMFETAMSLEIVVSFSRFRILSYKFLL